ncbi:mannitol dehydrogenase family protein [Microbacterium sp. BWT-B31]|uniref:mannitol dehydrogenase family protein n=1 Tax=Microbacterium sp. BWT-B31 TaxID=3232072 RepID=UPI00352799CA
MSAPRLSRTALAAAGRPLAAAPVRIVHLGAGAFHRAHQAWYTARATDAADWGIAAFTGRSDQVVRRLAPQRGVFTLVERGPQHDRFELVGSIAEVHPAADLHRLRALVAAPETAVVTLTVTEAGYRLRPDGELDLDDPDVAADIAALAGDGRLLRTPLARLLRALDDRRLAHANPLAIVPCDNLPANGERVRRALASLARAAGVADASAVASFVTTSVDRITPRTTAADLDAVEAGTGWRDEAAVVTEPFTDWTLCGQFPAGRPQWEAAGARFVDDIEPAVRRKLLLLNGGHLVLAFEGQRRGCTTVADAMRVRECRAALERFWDEADRTCGGGNAEYRAQLVARFENPRIEHGLAQIAVDTVTKLRLRVLPVVRAERAAGRSAAGAAGVVAAWAACLRDGLATTAGDPAGAFAALAEAADERDAAFLASAAVGER